MKAIDDAVRADVGVNWVLNSIAEAIEDRNFSNLTGRLWELAEIAGHAGAIAVLKDSIAGMSK